MYSDLLCSMIKMNSHEHLSNHKEPDSGAEKLFITRAHAWHAHGPETQSIKGGKFTLKIESIASI